MATPAESAHPSSFLSTQRTDGWWAQPIMVLLGLLAFVVYATYRVLEPTFVDTAGWATVAHNPLFTADLGVAGGYHYASPFGNPDLTFLVPAFISGLPVIGLVLSSPGAVLLPFPAGFRFTCYYYRKAYYRAFAARPMGCGVEAARGAGYKGETRLMTFQNLHRYFLYAAIVVVAFNAFDAFRSIYTPNGWYFGVGSFIMLVNVALLSGYTFGCHSLRHLIGGNLDCFSCSAVGHARHSLWAKVTMLNNRHMFWAWTSLVWVAFTDWYIRYLAQTGITELWGLPA